MRNLVENKLGGQCGRSKFDGGGFLTFICLCDHQIIVDRDDFLVMYCLRYDRSEGERRLSSGMFVVEWLPREVVLIASRCAYFLLLFFEDFHDVS